MVTLIYRKPAPDDMRSLDDLMAFDRRHTTLTGELFRDLCPCELDSFPGNPVECKYVRVTATRRMGVRIRHTFSVGFFIRPLQDGQHCLLLEKS